MKLEDIYKFFENPPPNYLCQEQAVCYIAYVLLQGESYGTELIDRLETEHPCYKVSDTVFYSAMKFLEEQKGITRYWQKSDRRGRPKRMYQISPDWEAQARHLAHLWQEYINKTSQ